MRDYSGDASASLCTSSAARGSGPSRGPDAAARAHDEVPFDPRGRGLGPMVAEAQGERDPARGATSAIQKNTGVCVCVCV